jgi:catechol 2,3-dioxygenase
VVLDVKTADGVRELYDTLKKAGISAQTPAALSEPGGGFGFGFTDQEGRALAVCSDVSDHKPLPDDMDRPRKIAHVNLNAIDVEKTNRLFIDQLEFKLIDHSGPLTFLHCSSTDHSSIVTCAAGKPTLNHIAFELPYWESVMRGAGRMRDAGYPIEWGVGRHSAGNNVFAYFAGPDEMPLEYTAEVAQIDDSYVPHGPDYWRFPPGRMDQWGVTPPHTQRWKRIQNMHEFAKGDFALKTKK